MRNAANPYKAILFDFDGTLCDSWVIVYKTYIDTLLHFEPDSTTEHVEDIKVCNDYLKSFQLLFKRQNIEQEIFEYANNLYYKNLDEKTPLFDKVETIIRLINEKRIPWGIVTTKRRIFVEKIISQYPILQSYTALICSEDVANGKPHPEGLIKSCEKLLTIPSDTIYIGDLISDILAAQACGMDSVLALYGYSEEHVKLNLDSTYKVLLPENLENVLLL